MISNSIIYPKTNRNLETNNFKSVNFKGQNEIKLVVKLVNEAIQNPEFKQDYGCQLANLFERIKSEFQKTLKLNIRQMYKTPDIDAVIVKKGENDIGSLSVQKCDCLGQSHVTYSDYTNVETGIRVSEEAGQINVKPFTTSLDL